MVVSRLICLLALFSIGLLGRSVCAQSYAVTDIGVIAGASYSYPKDMNDSGAAVRVVGFTRTKQAGYYHAFYWDSATHQIIDIGAIGAGNGSTAVDVNAGGDVVGYSATSADGSNNRAFYWHPTLGARNLQTLPYPAGFEDGVHGTTSAARAINDAGVIAGNVYRTDIGTFPVYWHRDSGTGPYVCELLPQLPGSLLCNGSGALDINERGDITGAVGSPTILYNARAFVWTNAGAPGAPIYPSASDAGMPGDSVWYSSGGSFINESGLISGTAEEPGASHRFTWSPGAPPVDVYDSSTVTGFSDSGASTGTTYEFANGQSRAYLRRIGTTVNLGVLGSGTGSAGNGINSSDVVVGASAVNRQGDQHGFRWTQTGGMVDLNSVTPSKGTITSLTKGIRVTDSGNIACEGLIKGNYTHAVLLTRIP